jgi:hopanoid biosynthesis associated protein HpnK
MSETRAPELIITGDDFGSSISVNRAILKAHREGVLTHASLMVNEDAASDAISIAKSNPGLSVGLHLVLVLGRTALPHMSISHIADRSGQFSKSPFKAGVHYYFSRAARDEIRREMRAQFEQFARSGLPFSHVDGHNHLHMHPVIFEELVKLCEQFRVKRIRMVSGEVVTKGKTSLSPSVASSLLGGVFDLLARSATRELAASNAQVPSIRVYGLAATGKINETYLEELIQSLDLVDTEIYLHPLVSDASQRELSLNPNGPRELDALLAPRVRAAIESKGFRLALASCRQ